MIHAGLVNMTRSILGDVGIPDMAVVMEARGIRTVDATRPGVVVVLDFFAEGKHLVIDDVVATVCCNSIL